MQLPTANCQLLTAYCKLPTDYLSARMKLFTIPNLFTLGNLLCGCIAIVFAFEGNLVWSAYLVGIAAVLDFLDGFLARLLKQHSEIGKQLDSLADMVTFGVVPGVVMFRLIKATVVVQTPMEVFGADGNGYENIPQPMFGSFTTYVPFIAFLIPLFSALRLAKFNIDTRQSDSFIGVPTPANSILICSLPVILEQQVKMSVLFQQLFSGRVEYSPFNKFLFDLLQNEWFLIGITLIMSFLLIAELPLFSLKFKKFGWKGNEIRYIFLLLCVAMLAVLKFVGIPLCVVLYILMSVGNNVMKKKSIE